MCNKNIYLVGFPEYTLSSSNLDQNKKNITYNQLSKNTTIPSIPNQENKRNLSKGKKRSFEVSNQPACLVAMDN
jgi:hypothetical protein